MKYAGAIVFAVAAVLLTISISPCRADTVHMKDGKTHNGKIIVETDSFIMIQTLVDADGGTKKATLRLQRKDIQEIIPGQPEAKPKPTKPSPKPIVKRPAAGQLDLGRIRRSVVLIRIIIGSRTYAIGSGFVVREDGVVYTNRHVIEVPDRMKASSKILIGVPSRKNPDVLDYFHAKIAIAAPESSGLDFAVLKIAAKRTYGRFAVMKTSSLGSGLGKGATVLGYPDSLSETPSLSVTKGTISSTNVKLDGRGYLQTDAAVNPGNSGGPMVNAAGHAIGLVTLRKARADNMGYALRLTEVSDTAKSAIAKIRSLSPAPGPIDAKELARFDAARPGAGPKGAPTGSGGLILETGDMSKSGGLMTVGNSGEDYWVTSERTLPEDFELTIACAVRFQRLGPSGSYLNSGTARLLCVRFGTHETALPVRFYNGWTLSFTHKVMYLYRNGKSVAFKNQGNSDRPMSLTIVKKGPKHTVYLNGKLMMEHTASTPVKGRYRFSIGGFESRLTVAGLRIVDISDKPYELPATRTGLIKALRSPDWATRNDAAVVLGLMGAESIPALLQAASDKHPFVRERAVEYLGKLAARSKSGIPAVLKVVRSALADKTMEVRRSGLRAVISLAAAAAPLAADVIKVANVRYKSGMGRPASTNDIALDAVKSIGPSCLPHMVRSVCNRDRVSATAMTVLRNCGAPAVPVIIKAFKGAVPEVRIDFVRTLKPQAATDDRVGDLMKTVLKTDKDWRVREAVINDFGAAKNDKIGALVIAAMKDDRDEVRKAATKMLTIRAGSGDDKAVKALADVASEHEDWEVRRAMLSDLVKRSKYDRKASKNFIPTMIKALGDPNANIRTMAVQWLARRTDLTENAIPPLIEVLDDESDTVRYGAVCALAKIKSPKVIAPLSKVLKSAGTPGEKKTVATELCKRGPAGLDVILTVGRDPDSPGHDAALTALRYIKPLPPKAVTLFAELLESRDPKLRQLGMNTLANMQTPAKTLLKVFLARLSDPDRSTAHAAKTAVVKYGDDAIPGLLDLLASESPSIRKTAIDCLSAVQGKFASYVPALRKAYLNETDTSVRASIVALIGKIKAKGVSEILHMIVLKDDQSQIWRSALGYLSKTGEPLIPRFAELLASGDEETRMRMVKVLGHLRSTKGLGALEAALDDKVLLVRIHAALILAAAKRTPDKIAGPLAEGMGVADETLAANCRGRLVNLGDRAVPELAKAMASDNKDLCRKALTGLGGLNTEKALEAVKTVRTHKIAEIRWQAAHILAMANGLTEELAPDAVSHMITTRASSSRMGAHMREFGERIIPILEKALEHPDWEARRRAVSLMFGQLKNEKIIPLLIKATKDKNGPVRTRAKELLKIARTHQERGKRS